MKWSDLKNVSEMESDLLAHKLGIEWESAQKIKYLIKHYYNFEIKKINSKVEEK